MEQLSISNENKSTLATALGALALIAIGGYLAMDFADDGFINLSYLNPDPDMDDDGISNADEIRLHTRVDKADTDGDGNSDFQELVKERHPDGSIDFSAPATGGTINVPGLPPIQFGLGDPSLPAVLDKAEVADYPIINVN